MKAVEVLLEKGLFASRWLLAPFYLGLAGSLILLLFSFVREMWHFVITVGTIGQTEVVLAILSLIDLSLAGNLVLIVIFSGYENFVSKLDIGDHADKFDWLGTLDFDALKLKLIASIVAISGIQLLKVFMGIGREDYESIKWMIIVHLTFIITGVLMAFMDRIAASTRAVEQKLKAEAQ